MPFYPVTFPVNEADGLLIEDLQLQQLIDYLNAKKVKSVYVCSMENFLFLEQCKELEHIAIELQVLPKHYSKMEHKGKRLIKSYDILPLYGLKKLKSISIIDNEEPYIISKLQIDLSRFTDLELFSGEYKYIYNLGQAKKLKTIRLNDYNKETLEELSELIELDTLELNMSKLKSLKGCKTLSRLQCIYLYYNRCLQDISDLKYVKHSLKALRIENCGKINDFSVLGELENLESLALIGSNEISDISFVKKLKNLKTFVFTVNIQDGDLSPCLGLQHACCAKGRKHYNLKDAKLPKGEWVRGNESIEMWRRFE